MHRGYPREGTQTRGGASIFYSEGRGDRPIGEHGDWCLSFNVFKSKCYRSDYGPLLRGISLAPAPHRTIHS